MFTKVAVPRSPNVSTEPALPQTQTQTQPLASDEGASALITPHTLPSSVSMRCKRDKIMLSLWNPIFQLFLPLASSSLFMQTCHLSPCCCLCAQTLFLS